MTAVERGRTNEVAPALRDGDYDLAGGDIEGNTSLVTLSPPLCPECAGSAGLLPPSRPDARWHEEQGK
jgi:hypothetical protein